MRHCERSEAIQLSARCWMDCFVALAPRNDGEQLNFASSRTVARRSPANLSSAVNEAAVSYALASSTLRKRTSEKWPSGGIRRRSTSSMPRAPASQSV